MILNYHKKILHTDKDSHLCIHELCTKIIFLFLDEPEVRIRSFSHL